MHWAGPQQQVVAWKNFSAHSPYIYPIPWVGRAGFFSQLAKSGNRERWQSLSLAGRRRTNQLPHPHQEAEEEEGHQAGQLRHQSVRAHRRRAVAAAGRSRRPAAAIKKRPCARSHPPNQETARAHSGAQESTETGFFPIPRSPECQTTAAALSCKNATRDGEAKGSRLEDAQNWDAPNAADGTTDSGELEPKNRIRAAAAAAADAAPCKNPTQDGKAQESRVEGAKNFDAPNAAAGSTDSGDLEPSNRLQVAAAASSKKSEEDEGQAEEPSAAVASDSCELEFCAPGGKEHTKVEEDTSVRTCGAFWVWNFFSRPLLEQRRIEGLNFLRKKTSLLNCFFECCGLSELIDSGDLKVPDDNLKAPHVAEKRTLISEAESYYKIEKPLAKNLSNLYSSFRVVLGDGECFYRSFIYSYLELVLENDDQFEENRLLCALENVSRACMCFEGYYDDFCKSYMAFKDLVEKVKSWKTETRAVRRMLLLSYFRDYTETEAILSFLRISSAAWLLTHPELSAFFAPEDDTTLEEHCQVQIIQRRSYADHLAISALSDALGIQIQIFSFPMENNLHTAPSGESNVVAVPVVSLVFTGIHYDILYPI